MRTLARRMRGIAIVTAIFILVVLAALGAFMVSISTSQQIGSALDVQGVQAYQAARAGIEWGLHRQLQAGSCVGATSFSPTASALSAFTVTVVCTPTPDPGGFGAPTVYSVSATACTQPNVAEPKCPNASPAGFYVERRLSVAF